MLSGMEKTTFASWPCTIARTADLLGDGWTLLILREAYYGETRFDAFISTLGIARNTLTDRLRKLVEAGVLERREYQTQPVRHEYVLTDSGRDFFPVMAAMKTWGDTWMNHGQGVPVDLVHDLCQRELTTHVVCAHCGDALRLDDVHAEAGPSFPRRLLEKPRIAARFRLRDDGIPPP
jgi:DNA-binding HxlR family transcriptional regulator